jgi:hypothetical protein
MVDSHISPAHSPGLISFQQPQKWLDIHKGLPGTPSGNMPTLLKANGEDVKVVQELLRHASSRVTLDVYADGHLPTLHSSAERAKLTRLSFSLRLLFVKRLASTIFTLLSGSRR